MFIGSSLATGVIAPVLPTCKSMSLTLDRAFSELNFAATAHLGYFDVLPNIF